MSSFWITIAVQEAIGVAQAFVSISSLTPGVKTALENFISSGQTLLITIQTKA